MQSILHFSENDKPCCEVGSGVPTIWSNKHKQIVIFNAVDDTGNYNTKITHVKPRKWHKLEISQIFKDDEVIFIHISRIQILLVTFLPLSFFTP